MSTLLSAQSRTVSKPDPDAFQVDPWPITGAVWISIGATCDVPSGTLRYRLIITDAAGIVTGVSGPYTYAAASGPADWFNAWLGTPTADYGPAMTVCGDRLILKVDQVTGVWKIAAQTFCPPPPKLYRSE